MARPTFYSILFLDSDGNHKSSDATNGLTFYKSIDNLLSSLQESTEIKFPVCICSSNKSNILGKLEKHSNVACIFICAEHHRGLHTENQVTNNTRVKEKKFSDEPLRWQMDAHTEALLANADHGQSNVAAYIENIINSLIEQSSHIPQIPQQAVQR
ncbi:unnamed protein product [Rotaria sordida]|uniref:Uncharacterized protein n=1 Tax=Rotaria sordida TaxID=392033 RepID=A0A813T5W8_9BILA|nr:unnamed protein product [Rotaria sordida]CAF1051700.1 unnamed protein product [Rotaria sordida]CAF1053931.1 unnamed protein product [Rotaria sordida]CAF1157744.1 unnamed protein product [Rotaria sordida]CAF4088742.1 unnamed protein product [Rotaria sordida]